MRWYDLDIKLTPRTKRRNHWRRQGVDIDPEPDRERGKPVARPRNPSDARNFTCAR
jgi:hypothetical protein